MKSIFAWGVRHKGATFFLFLFVVGGLYFFFFRSTSQKSVRYVTTTAERGMLTTAISGSGNVIMGELATVDPTISGTVSNLSVNVGDTVVKGQHLFTIINNDLSVSSARSVASLQQSKNSLDSALLQVKQAKEDYRAGKKDSANKTQAEEAILKKKISIAESAVTYAEQSYQAMLADYHNQQSLAGERNVVAPIAGTVNAVNIKNGDDLSRLSRNSASQAPIIIGDSKTLQAQVAVNEVDIANISLHQKAMMVFMAIDGLNVSGEVEKMDAIGTITQGVVNYNVTISLDTMDNRLRPGMSVSAQIITDVKQDVITVPNSALKVRGNKNYIEVLNSTTKQPEQRTIEIGSANNTDTEIVSGVNVNDAVITQTIDPNAQAPTTSSSNSFRIPGLGGGGR